MKSRYTKCLTVLLAAGVIVAAPAFASGDRGTEVEAQEMVKKALALIKSAGPEAAYKAFTEHPNGAFKDRDLYVFVYDFQGNCLAQGANPKMIGMNLIELKDMNGKPIIRGQIEMVKSQKAGWFGPYKFPSPVTKVQETKKSYCEQGAPETIVCVGAYVGNS